MVRDIVFEQNYAKKIDQYIHQVGTQAFNEGRQRGWNEMILILNELKEQNIEISQETIVKELQKMLFEQGQQADKEKTTTEKKGSNLSVVK